MVHLCLFHNIILLVLGATRVSLGFGFTATALLFRAFSVVFGLGSSGCRLFAFVLALLAGYLPCLFGFNEILPYQLICLFNFV